MGIVKDSDYVTPTDATSPTSSRRRPTPSAWCREKRQPVFLHISTVRMLGHAGSDVETEYRTREEIEAVEALDPLLESARFAISSGP
jgi:hypothetical protein